MKIISIISFWKSHSKYETKHVTHEYPATIQDLNSEQWQKNIKMH